ncbi:MAG: DUF1338 domain-containing protein [Lentisphaeria bacterium]|nr:DUF1338 domain-containing protein [Lentisphaeria bacterium]NQZ67493.1 DUF1338 domain-containing protein [Lentisphaeria bacterium]
MNTLETLFDKLWTDYISMNPQVNEIHDLLISKDENVVNDHIALRTFEDARINKEKIAQSFLAVGYHEVETYMFDMKGLNAFHLEHKNPENPKVFISELCTNNLSKQAQDIIETTLDSIPLSVLDDFYLSSAGRLWPANYDDYNCLLSESDYAAWVYAFGFRVNHFTVCINALSGWDDIADFNSFIKDNGFQLNNSGGEIKGSPELLLEQSSTMANAVRVDFSDGKHEIPYCFYEFAKRYKMPNGNYFQGFVTQSANKLFESTNRDS